MKLYLLKIIKNILFNIICLINLFLLIFGIIIWFTLAYINIYLNKYRDILINIKFFIFSKVLKVIFIKRIKYINKTNKINQERNFTLINANHYHNLDWIFMLYILKNQKGENIITISKENKSNFENIILKIYNPLFLNDNKNINQLFEEFKLKFIEKNKFYICYFEGRSLNHQKNNTYYKYTNQPKKILYKYFQNTYPNNYFYDINIVYKYRNKIIKNKDKFFLLKILHPYSRIYFQINRYKFGDNDIEDIYKIKNSQIEQIISKINKH